MEAWEGAPLWTACLQGQPQGADDVHQHHPPDRPAPPRLVFGAATVKARVFLNPTAAGGDRRAGGGMASQIPTAEEFDMTHPATGGA